MLTAEQVSQYRRDGYTLCEELLHKQEVITLLAEIEQVTESQIRRPRPSARPAGADPASASGAATTGGRSVR